MNLIQSFGRTAVNAVTTGMTVQSVQKMLNEFGGIINPAVTISMTLKNRRIGDSVFDFNDYDIGMMPGQTFNKGAYMGFETIFVKSVVIQPYTELVIVNQNRFLKKTVIHNGTPFPQQHNFTFIKPMAFNIYCTNCVADGRFVVHDGSKWLDARLWSIIGAALVVSIIVILLIVSAFSSSSSDTVEAFNGEQENVRRSYEARIDDLSDFNRSRTKITNVIGGR